MKFLIGIALIAAAFAGTDVQKGGDAIECAPSKANTFSGYYSLDYLAQFDPQSPAVAATSLDASLDRIEANLRSKLPEMMSSFQDFRKNLFNERDLTANHVWEKSAFGLVDLKDEALVSKMPDNCLANGKASIVQAAVRQPPGLTGRPPGKYLYKYVPEVINQLRANNPVQLSFLLIHEWLWDFSSNVDRNRRVNYLLHSARLDQMSRDELLQALQGLGFSVPSRQDPVFEPAICPADAGALARLKGRLNRPDGNLSFGKAYMRNRLCNDQTGCSAFFRDKSDIFAMNFATYIRLDAIGGRLMVRSQESGGLRNVHISCQLVNGAFKCDPFLISGGYEYDPRLIFKVEAGDDCVRLTSQAASPVTAHDTQADEYVIYFSNVHF